MATGSRLNPDHERKNWSETFNLTNNAFSLNSIPLIRAFVNSLLPRQACYRARLRFVIRNALLGHDKHKLSAPSETSPQWNNCSPHL